MMTYSQFLDWDTYNIYSDYVSISEAKILGIIPRKLTNIIPETCKCGSENIITTNLKRMRCCDPNCVIKMGKAMSHMFTNFNIQGLGDETCIKIVKHCIRRNLFTLPSHVEVLGIEIDQEMSSFLGAKSENLAIGRNVILNSSLTFGEMIKKMSLPMFNNSSEDIFKGINGIGHFLELIDTPTGLIGFMNSRGVKDIAKIDTLRRNLGAILHLESIMKKDLRMTSNVTRTISITGSVSVDGIRYTREGFVGLCNSEANINGIQLFNVKENTAITTNRYIIADNPCSHNKYLVGKRREAIEGVKIIITAQEFVDIIRKEVSACIEVMKKKSLE